MLWIRGVVEEEEEEEGWLLMVDVSNLKRQEEVLKGKKGVYKTRF